MDGELIDDAVPLIDDAVTSVAVVDDHELVREGLVSACESHGALKVTYAGADLAELRCLEDRPDLVLLDLDLGDHSVSSGDVIELIERGSCVLIVSALGSPATVRTMVRAGVAGFVSKREGTGVLFEAIDAVLAGSTWTTPDLAAILSRDLTRPSLSDREARALVLYASGLKIQSVARQLGVKPSTAREYIERVRAKYSAVGRYAPTKVHLRAVASEDGLFDE